MKIPIDIRVRSERTQSVVLPTGETRDKKETDDYTVSGIMKKTRNGLLIEFSDEDSITSINTFKDNKVAYNRSGAFRTPLVFGDGFNCTCICTMGPMPIQMHVRTKKLENSLTLDGGKLDIDYSIEIAGNLAERTSLSLSVSPDASIIKS